MPLAVAAECTDAVVNAAYMDVDFMVMPDARQIAA